MGTILQEQVAQRCAERVSNREGKWKKDLWSIAGPNVGSNKMGRRQSQRKPTPPRHAFPSQDNNSEKRLPQRRKHKSNNSSAKRNTSQHSAHRSSESKPLPVSPTEGRMEPKVLPVAKRCSHRQRKHTGSRESKHTAAVSYHCLSGCSTEQLERHSPELEIRRLSCHGEDDSDTDLSESERLPVSVCSRVPPRLELRPEVIKAEDCSSRSHRTNLQGHGGFDFPDFLPPPFNSWSLSQLAVFYNMEGRGTPRPRPVGPLERYLERLLQLEWCQIQTVQEESGKSAVSEVIFSCHRSPAAATSRLSSPKCILQCQRAFPLTFLSSLASHSAILSGCACSLCRIRCSRCSAPCSCSTYSHNRQSRPSAALEPKILPKRSYSENRVHSSDRGSQAQRFSSPVWTNSHLRRMQASGNIRNPVQGAATSFQHTASDCNEVVWRGDVLDYRMGGFRRRSSSEQRRGGGDRKQNESEKKRSGSECRKRGAERRRAAYLKEQEIKPDAVTAIIDNLPGSKYSPIRKPSRPKQVEFVT